MRVFRFRHNLRVYLGHNQEPLKCHYNIVSFWYVPRRSETVQLDRYLCCMIQLFIIVDMSVSLVLQKIMVNLPQVL